MRSYACMWRVLVRVGAAMASCILMQPLFLPYDHAVAFTAEVMWTSAFGCVCVCVLKYLDDWVFNVLCILKSNFFLNRYSWP